MIPLLGLAFGLAAVAQGPPVFRAEVYAVPIDFSMPRTITFPKMTPGVLVDG